MKLNSTFTLACLTLTVMIGYYVYAGQKRQETVLTTVRNNWTNYVYMETTNYADLKVGETDGLQIPVRNNMNFVVDEVEVTVGYIKEGGEIYKEEKVAIFNIPPNSVKRGNAPSSLPGTSVQLKISRVVSHSLNLCFPGSNRDYRDPYKCN